MRRRLFHGSGRSNQPIPTELTVSLSTKEALDRICKRADIAAGAALDYVLLNYKPDSPDLVAPTTRLAIETCLSGLDGLDYEKAIIKVAAAFAAPLLEKQEDREMMDAFCETIEIRPMFAPDDAYYQCIREVDADDARELEQSGPMDSSWGVKDEAANEPSCTIEVKLLPKALKSLENNARSLNISSGATLDRFMKYFAMRDYRSAADFLSRELAQISSWGGITGFSQSYLIMTALLIGRLPMSRWDDLHHLMEQNMALSEKEMKDMDIKVKARTLLMVSRMGKKEAERTGGIKIEEE